MDHMDSIAKCHFGVLIVMDSVAKCVEMAIGRADRHGQNRRFQKCVKMAIGGVLIVMDRTAASKCVEMAIGGVLRSSTEPPLPKPRRLRLRRL